MTTINISDIECRSIYPLYRICWSFISLYLFLALRKRRKIINIYLPKRKLNSDKKSFIICILGGLVVGSKGSAIFFNIVSPDHTNPHDEQCQRHPHHTRKNQKMNKRISLFALLVLTTLSISYAQKMVLNSLWRDSVITVDGNLDDWDQPFRYFDSKSKLQYSIANDDKYIYVSVKTNDDKAQMKVMRAGMDVWFDVTGKKKDIATVHFPLKTDPKLDMINDPMAPDQQIVERPDIKKMKMDWNEANKEVHTQGFRNVPLKFTENDSVKYPIEVAVSWDRYDAMTYELRVPFSAFYKDSLVASDTLRPITIGIRANAMDLPMIPTNSAADVTGAAGGGMNSMTNTNTNSPGGMPNTMANTQRPQTSSPQPTLAIPRGVAEMGVALVVAVKIKLAHR